MRYWTGEGTSNDGLMNEDDTCQVVQRTAQQLLYKQQAMVSEHHLVIN